MLSPAWPLGKEAARTPCPNTVRRNEPIASFSVSVAAMQRRSPAPQSAASFARRQSTRAPATARKAGRMTAASPRSANQSQNSLAVGSSISIGFPREEQACGRANAAVTEAFRQAPSERQQRVDEAGERIEAAAPEPERSCERIDGGLRRLRRRVAVIALHHAHIIGEIVVGQVLVVIVAVDRRVDLLLRELLAGIADRGELLQVGVV